MNKLAERVAIVSGAGRGIGRAIALKLAHEGACVVVNDLDAESAHDTVDEIECDGGAAVACVGSVTETEFAQRFVDAAVKEFGGLDIVVNNAGYTWDTVIHKMGDEQWQAMLDVHLTGPFRVLRAAAPVIRDTAKREAQEGREVFRKVVNVSSVAGLGGNPGQVNYAAAKAGILGVTKTLAKEWGRYRVNVNSVAFGVIRTRLSEVPADGQNTVDIDGREIKIGINPQAFAMLEQVIPLGRVGTPEEAAGAVYLLCTPESNYVSGEVLVCGGGLNI